MGRFARAVIVLGCALTLVAIGPTTALAATGPYTLPFFTPTGVTRGYGCTSGVGDVWDGTNADGIIYDCNPRFHKGIDYDTDTRGIAAARAGVVVKLYTQATGSTYPNPSTGNYVILKHTNPTAYSIYYHLEHGSIEVEFNEEVSAGQHLGQSGETGNASGPHLHYELMNCNCSNSDPEDTYKPNGKWTTDPGRVPWLAEVYAQNASSYDICYGDTVAHWVWLRNTGGRTWSHSNDAYGNGRIILQSTNTSGSATFPSPFWVSGDWEDSVTPGTANASSVAPDSIGVFSFGLHAGGVSGNSYNAHFNLRAVRLRYFLYSELDEYHLDIFVVPPQAC